MKNTRPKTHLAKGQCGHRHWQPYNRGYAGPTMQHGRGNDCQTDSHDESIH